MEKKIDQGRNEEAVPHRESDHVKANTGASQEYEPNDLQQCANAKDKSLSTVIGAEYSMSCKRAESRRANPWVGDREKRPERQAAANRPLGNP